MVKYPCSNWCHLPLLSSQKNALKNDCSRVPAFSLTSRARRFISSFGSPLFSERLLPSVRALCDCAQFRRFWHKTRSHDVRGHIYEKREPNTERWGWRFGLKWRKNVQKKDDHSRKKDSSNGQKWFGVG